MPAHPRFEQLEDIISTLRFSAHVYRLSEITRCSVRRRGVEIQGGQGFLAGVVDAVGFAFFDQEEGVFLQLHRLAGDCGGAGS